MRLIDVDALPLEKWTREAQYFQDDILVAHIGAGFMKDKKDDIGDSFMRTLAEDENRYLFKVIKAIREAPTVNNGDNKNDQTTL